jgi:hypothetical protein
MIAGVHCEQDHCRFWGNGANLSGRFQTIHNRHRQVQDDDIRAKGFNSFDRNSSILCLTANSPIAPLLEPGSKRSTDFCAVVHDQHGSGHFGLKERIEQPRPDRDGPYKRPLRDHCGSVRCRQYSRNCTLSITSVCGLVPYMLDPSHISSATQAARCTTLRASSMSSAPSRSKTEFAAEARAGSSTSAMTSEWPRFNSSR